MQTLRIYLSWLYAFTSLVCLRIGFSETLSAVRQQHGFESVHDGWRSLLLFTAPLMMIAFAFVFGMAWWTVFQQRPSARGWGIAASLINIQVSLLPLILPPHSIWNGFLLILALGVAGLVAFGRKFEPSTPTATPAEIVGLPADGTNQVINRLFERRQ